MASPGTDQKTLSRGNCNQGTSPASVRVVSHDMYHLPWGVEGLVDGEVDGAVQGVGGDGGQG